MKEHVQLLLRATSTDLTITYPRIINYIACVGRETLVTNPLKKNSMNYEICSVQTPSIAFYQSQT